MSNLRLKAMVDAVMLLACISSSAALAQSLVDVDPNMSNSCSRMIASEWCTANMGRARRLPARIRV